jgi:hypothetical protein
MTGFRRAVSMTPRLFVVGSIVFGIACSRRQPAATPAPAPRPTPPAPRAITGGTSLVEAMAERYAGKWYKTLTFVQKTTLHLASGSQVRQTWYESAELPGKLRIDTDRATKTGVMFVGDSAFTFSSGKLVKADTGRNELLVLGFDAYAQPAARTVGALRRAGFDLTKFHETTWRGKPVYVVGAAAGDTTSKQFWVERERLLFVRLIERTPQGRSDVRFDNYVPAGGGWIAIEVEQIVNGRRRLFEEYTDVRTDIPLSPALFDPRQWVTAPHWARPPGDY